MNMFLSTDIYYNVNIVFFKVYKHFLNLTNTFKSIILFLKVGFLKKVLKNSPV